jgi:Holliday junction DNA helicase RuvA
MIDYLRGELAHREMDYVVVDVGGVGYRVFCSNPFAVSADSADRVTLFIHYHVREDAILLYGFPTREEQGLFRKLLDVSGVGPRVALGILSAGRPEAIVSAIDQEDVTFLTRLPGIGKKTAQRIILDLKDKLDHIPVSEAAASANEGNDTRLTHTGGGAWNEARQALLALGYSEAEADRAWSAVKGAVTGEESADALVKLALQALFRG